jgi:hypothetical protein
LNSTERGCPHWWIIESANGPKSLGRCKYCHAEKEFLNSAPISRKPLGGEQHYGEQSEMQTVPDYA